MTEIGYCIRGVLRILFYFKGMIFLYIIRENSGGENEFLITISLLIKIFRFHYCIRGILRILFYFKGMIFLYIIRENSGRMEINF